MQNNKIQNSKSCGHSDRGMQNDSNVNDVFSKALNQLIRSALLRVQCNAQFQIF